MKKMRNILLTAVVVMSALTTWGNHPWLSRVYEYRPAPGQYVNDVPEYEEGDTEADMIRKCNESIAGKAPNDVDAHIVALGGWGGYITFHFDHSIANIPVSATLQYGEMPIRK